MPWLVLSLEGAAVCLWRERATAQYEDPLGPTWRDSSPPWSVSGRGNIASQGTKELAGAVVFNAPPHTHTNTHLSIKAETPGEGVLLSCCTLNSKLLNIGATAIPEH